MKNKWLRRALITATVVVLAWFVLPLFFNKRVNESREAITGQPTTSGTPVTDIPEQAAAEPQGTFVGVTGHQASGTATLINNPEGNFIRLEDDFSVTSGPDLYVYAGNKDEKTQEIARLKGNRGGQNYQLPPGIDPASFDTLWIYCKAFSINFAKAELKS